MNEKQKEPEEQAQEINQMLRSKNKSVTIDLNDGNITIKADKIILK